MNPGVALGKTVATQVTDAKLPAAKSALRVAGSWDDMPKSTS